MSNLIDQSHLVNQSNSLQLVAVVNDTVLTNLFFYQKVQNIDCFYPKFYVLRMRPNKTLI